MRLLYYLKNRFFLIFYSFKNFFIIIQCYNCKKVIENYEFFGLCPECNKNFFNVELKESSSEDFNFKYFYEYKDIKNILYMYKYLGYKNISKFFSNLILNKYKIEGDFVFIPAPSSVKRRKKEKWNQVILILEQLNVPYYDIFEKKGRELKFLNRNERQMEIKNIYFNDVKKIDNLRDKKIILIDDVKTTGSTLKKCRELLEEKGLFVKDVIVFGASI